MPTPEEEQELSTLCDGDPLARALAKLRPASSEILTKEFCFQAGAASQSQPVTFWRRIACIQAAALAVLATSVGLLLAFPGEAQVKWVQLHLTQSSPQPISMSEESEVAPMPRPMQPIPEYPTEHYFAKLTDDSPSLEERARLAVLHRDIMLAGLGTVPQNGTHTTAAPPAWQGTLGHSGNVYAAPILRKPDSEQPRE
jgi:hypothetical protein